MESLFLVHLLTPRVEGALHLPGSGTYFLLHVDVLAFQKGEEIRTIRHATLEGLRRTAPLTVPKDMSLIGDGAGAETTLLKTGHPKIYATVLANGGYLFVVYARAYFRA